MRIGVIRDLGFRAFAVMLGLMAIGLGLEITLRLARPEARTEASRAAPAGHRAGYDNEWVFFEYDPLLGWRNRPGAEGWFSIPDSRTWVRVNRDGLREAERQDTARDRHTVLALGDSFTWGFGVEQGERFTDLLGSYLPPEVEIINAGVSGYGTDQELLYLESRGLDRKPELVLVEFGLEDVLNNNSSVQYSYPKPFFSLENDRLTLSNVPVPRRSVHWHSRFDLPKHLHAERVDRGAAAARSSFQSLKLFLRQHSLGYGFVVDRIHRLWTPEQRAWILHQSPDAVTAALFKDLQRVTADHDAALVVLLIPYNFHMPKGSGDHEHDAYVRFFHDAGIPCLDLWPAFRRETAKGRSLYFEIDPHWTPEGHELAAELIAEYLLTSASLPGAGAQGLG